MVGEIGGYNNYVILSVYNAFKWLQRRLSIWLCLITKMQGIIAVYWLLIHPLKMCQNSSIWEQQ